MTDKPRLPWKHTRDTIPQQGAMVVRTHGGSDGMIICHVTRHPKWIYQNRWWLYLEELLETLPGGPTE